MLNARWKPVFYVMAGLVGIWVLALSGYFMARGARVTPEKIRAFVSSTDFKHLSREQRLAAINKLGRMLDSLSLEERRHAHLDRVAWSWFQDMTEEEKGRFIDVIMPTGFKQMLAAFEKLPGEKRRRAIDNTLKRVREDEARGPAANTNASGTNRPALSPELEAKVRSIGLQTFYSQSSAETKAELAPVIEELQRGMETGRAFRGR
ncbi:MAG TPA: hypothetical protein VHH88_12885 [Verrucomicrobiae bacterium]|nr:hypothetical protein [Verrucomicrobiae bacterium]